MDTLKSFFYQGKTDLEREHNGYRRIFALGWGALLGFLYALMSQVINPLILPGIPYYQPPFGPLPNIFMGLVLGALIGLVAGWPLRDINGALLGGALAAVAVAGVTLLTTQMGGQAFLSQTASLFLLSLPVIIASVPAVGLFRWVISRQEDYRKQPLFSPVRFGSLLLTLALAIGMGSTLLYAPEGRTVLTRMHAMLSSTRTANDSTALPAALQPAEVSDFLAHHQANYSLEWVYQDLDSYNVPRPDYKRDEHTIGIARYDDGWVLVCLYPTPEDEPICRGF